MEQHVLEGVGNGEQKENLDLVGNAEGRYDRVQGRVLQAQRAGKRGKLLVVANILSHAAIVATWKIHQQHAMTWMDERGSREGEEKWEGAGTHLQ